MKRGPVLAAAGAVAFTLLAAGTDARVSDARADLKSAIAAEKRALADLEKGKPADAKKDLEASKSALESAKKGLTDPRLAPAVRDVQQALNADDGALGNLGGEVHWEFAKSRIRIAIIRKQAALELYEHVTAVPPNHPPKITEFSASFARPTTTYQVTATDPDPGDTIRLVYKWTKTQRKPCGVFTPRGQIATWSHPDADYAPPGDCPSEPVHAAVIKVTVSDGKGSSCTVEYDGGSAPVPPFDPGEDCKNVGVPSLTPAQATQLSNRLTSAIGLEEQAGGKLIPLPPRKKAAKKAAALLRVSDKILESVEGTLAEHGGTAAIENDVHIAGIEDRIGASDIESGLYGVANAEINVAIERKKDAKKKLDAIAGG